MLKECSQRSSYLSKSSYNVRDAINIVKRNLCSKIPKSAINVTGDEITPRIKAIIKLEQDVVGMYNNASICFMHIGKTISASALAVKGALFHAAGEEVKDLIYNDKENG